MSRQTPPERPPGVRELAGRVRTSHVLTGTLKRYWLSVLPHLRDEDRARLDAILRGEARPEPPAGSGR
jgi:hypothetical protein